jgi:eukaryotic-like serine/threonine-protein kinase
VLDMGLHEGDAYMALEYVDGKDLRKVAARARDLKQTLPLSFVLFVMGRVLDALAYAHRKKGDDETGLNLVHRDISPQNILISYEGEVKVIDFGLAKSRLSAAKTNPSIILGKFLYMSPEQARHQPVDRRSDLYAVGLCLYELLSGSNPFDQVPSGELMTTVAQPGIPHLSERVPSLPLAVTELVMKALAVEPSRRFQTAEEFRGQLLANLLSLEPGAGPESITRFMHELFAKEYQSERRLLASLKEAGRAPEAAGELAVAPLSFHPSPRTHEGGPVREEGETRPSLVMKEAPSEEVPGNDAELLLEQEPPGESFVEGEPEAEPFASETPAPEWDAPAALEADTSHARAGADIEELEEEAAPPPGPPHDTQPRVSLADAYGRESQPPPLLSREESTPAPSRHDVTLRMPVPKRPMRPWAWGVVALGMLLLGGGVGALVFYARTTVKAAAPPARPPPPPEMAAPAVSAPEPVAADAVEEAEGTAASSGPTVAEAGAPVVPAEVEAEDLLAPLGSESGSGISSGKGTSRKRTTSRRAKTVLQKEWVRTRTAYTQLRKSTSCEVLGMVCERFDDLRLKVEEAGEAENAALLGEVKQLRREIQNQKKRSGR